MSLSPVGSDQAQSIGSRLLQQLNAGGTGASNSASLSALLGDLMTLSPAAQQLTKAPEAVTKAMADLVSDQKDVPGDLAELKAYFKDHPERLASVLSSLQAGTATYGAVGSPDSNSALLTALMNGKSQNTSASTAALLNLLTGSQTPNLFDSMGDSGTGSESSSLSIFG